MYLSKIYISNFRGIKELIVSVQNGFGDLIKKM